jgi:hypothetical protein
LFINKLNVFETGGATNLVHLFHPSPNPSTEFPKRFEAFSCVLELIQKSPKKKGAKNWVVVLPMLKNINQWEGLSHILWKIKNVPNHQPEKVHHCWPIYFPQHDAIALPTSSH